MAVAALVLTSTPRPATASATRHPAPNRGPLDLEEDILGALKDSQATALSASERMTAVGPLDFLLTKAREQLSEEWIHQLFSKGERRQGVAQRRLDRRLRPRVVVIMSLEQAKYFIASVVHQRLCFLIRYWLAGVCGLILAR
jgi:hypothetical protein